MADQIDKSRIIFSPSTYERHRAAFDAVASSIVNRNPRKGSTRFPGVAPGAWGLLASGGSIGGISGGALGSGTVKLCDNEGNVYDPDESVDVYNAGGPITADGGDKLLPLEWTAGDWSVCGCTSEEDPFACVTACLPCAVPETDITVTLYSGDDTQAVRLAYDGDETWTSELTTTFGAIQITIVVSCTSGGAILSYSSIVHGLDCTSAAGGDITLDSYTCSPFQLDFQPPPSDPFGDPCNVFTFDWITVTAPIGWGPENYYCCQPCPVPACDLTISIDGGTSTTLVYDPETKTHSDGTHTLTCAGGGLTLTGGGSWAFDELDDGRTCDPFRVQFEDGGSTAVVQESVCRCRCPIPPVDLTLSFEGEERTLVYDSETETWSDEDGAFVLSCGDDGPVIADTFDPFYTTEWHITVGSLICDPWHANFTSPDYEYTMNVDE